MDYTESTDTEASHHAQGGADLSSQADRLQRRLAEIRPELRHAFADLIAIPSVAQPGVVDPAMRASAERIRDLFAATGGRVRIRDGRGMQPAVIASYPAPPSTPTVLLYAHHDVKPPGLGSAWRSPPFAAIEQRGRMYGRGAADNKSGVITHLTALRLCDGRPPVGVIVLIEGEEEISSPNFARILSEESEIRTADIAVVADGASLEADRPALNVSFRGGVELTVTVQTMDRPVHAGVFGGPVPDALTVLMRLLASMHAPDGSIAVKGLLAEDRSKLEFGEDALREYSGLLAQVQTIGRGSIAGRLWDGPSVTVTGMDVPGIAEASGSLLPEARARISVRLAPNDDPERAAAAITEHLQHHLPWGARLTLNTDELNQGWRSRHASLAAKTMRSALRTACGQEPHILGLGGGIPLIGTLQQFVPDLDIVITAIQDAKSNIHGPDESIDLRAVDVASISEALFFSELAKMEPPFSEQCLAT